MSHNIFEECTLLFLATKILVVPGCEKLREKTFCLLGQKVFTFLLTDTFPQTPYWMFRFPSFANFATNGILNIRKILHSLGWKSI